MSDSPDNTAADIEALRQQLAEAEETLRAIREGEVDALLIADATGERLYTLRTADTPYRIFVEQMHEGAATLGTDGRITYCNKRFAELTDVVLEQVMGMPVEDLLAEPADCEMLRRVLDDGVGTFRAHLAQDRGDPREVLISVATVSSDGEEQHTLIVTDMSHFARIERESREKDEFLAVLAHELRNPLAPMRNAVALLGHVDSGPSVQLRAREIIERQLAHMVRLIDDLLDLARINNGRIELRRERVDLAQVIEGALEISRPLVEAAEHTLHVSIPAAPLYVYGDAARLTQIVANILNNAAKYTETRGTIWMSLADSDGLGVVRVRDTGIGIASDILPYVFNMFLQAPPSRTKRGGGLGIGLSLVRRLVDLHGGSVEAVSGGRNQGTEVTVRVPLMTDEVVEVDSRIGLAVSSMARAARRVVVVDDNRDSADSLQLYLESEGHDVSIAYDGPSALALVREIEPHVVFLDIGLPGMSGYDVARAIRSSGGAHSPQLIAMTGWGQEEDRQRAKEAGFDVHLAKPIDPTVAATLIAESGSQD